MSFLDYDKADFMRAVRQQVNVGVGEDDTLSGTCSGIGPYTCHFCFILSEPNEIIFLMSCPDMSVPEHKVDSAVRLFKDLEGNVISNAKNENYTIFNHEIVYNSQFGIVFGTSIPMYELSENSADEYIKFCLLSPNFLGFFGLNG